MSRYSFIHPENNKHTITFGYDHALGYFFDIVDEEEEVIEEFCSRFDKLTGFQLHEKLVSIIGEKTDLKNKFGEQLEKMILDLQF